MTTRKQSGCVETCAICLEKLPLPTQETPVSVFKCGHVFHFECTRPLYEQCFRTIMRKRREMRRSWLYINFMTEEQRSNAIIDIRRNATWPCPVCRYPVKKHDLNVRLPKLRRLPIAVMRRREKKSRLITIHDLGRELDRRCSKACAKIETLTGTRMLSMSGGTWKKSREELMENPTFNSADFSSSNPIPGYAKPRLLPPHGTHQCLALFWARFGRHLGGHSA